MSFQGKIAWVTGASSGIGEALAKGLAARGAAVILSGRRVGELQRVAGEIGGQTLILPFEATDYAALPHIVRDAQAWLGGIDLLINTAGVSQRSLALDTDFSVYRHLMEVDFFAPLHLTQLVLPRMVERRSGQIAIISSVAGKAGVPLRTGYCAAKHACVGYFDALRSEVEAAYGIHVSVILPGSVKTAVAINAVRGDGSTFGRTDANIEGGMPADRAAGRILDGLAANQREIVVAEGRELGVVELRVKDPEALFALLAKEGARLAALRAQAGSEFSPEPAKFNASS
ncbi:MAG: SDR family NAD(P)-dependent oxidoreductase [Beijerinckiaceae bacterium]